jgi:CRP/FNR family cyclic AMP-dependent transcriptional regulator
MFSSKGLIEKQFFKEGECVFSEGDVGDAAYIVETGAVGIHKMVEGERIELAQMNEGELFGEMATIDGTARMASANAYEDSVIVKIPREAFESKLNKYDPFVKSLIQILVSNLRSVHQTYMKRPRSVNDYVNAISYHVDGFRGFMDGAGKNQETAAGLAHLDVIEAALKSLRSEVKDYKDSRSSVMDDTDIAVSRGNLDKNNGHKREGSET